MFEESSRYYDIIYSFKDYAAEAQRIDDIVRSRVPEPRTLLDVACGTGTHMEHLTSRYEIQGVDINEDLLALCRERNPGVALHLGDMRTFSLSDRFDAVVNLFSAIGYMTTEDDLRSSIRTMADHLRPGGVLIVEPWLFPGVFEHGRVDMLTAEDGDLKIARMSYGEQEGHISRIYFDFLVAERNRGTRHFTETHEMGMYEADVLVSAFEEAGLVEVEYDGEGLMGRGLIIGSAPS